MLSLSTPLLNKLFPYSILQTITSPKPSPPPTLKSWWLYRWSRFKQRTDNGDCSNGILSFLALSPVFSFHPYIKAGLWTLTEPTASSTRRLSWMKRERSVIMSWIHLSIPIHSSRLIGAWSIETLQNHKTIGLSKLDTPIALLIRTDITFIDQPLSIRVLLLQ